MPQRLRGPMLSPSLTSISEAHDLGQASLIADSLHDPRIIVGLWQVELR